MYPFEFNYQGPFFTQVLFSQLNFTGTPATPKDITQKMKSE